MPDKRAMPKIGTHSGSFHCDEALGCYLLSQTKQFKDASITRSRDPEVWKDMDIVIDVGGEYDAARHRYDHHQRGFSEVFGHGFTTKLSSAGLVYKHFGAEIVAARAGKAVDDDVTQTLWKHVYKVFVEAVDAVDNGVNMFDTDAPPRYEQNTTLPSRVGFLNPPWNVPHGNDDLDAQFAKAVALTGAEFDEALRYSIESWLPGRALVEEALAAAPSVHDSGEILRFGQACPWKSHLYDIEKDTNAVGKVKFVIFEDDREKKWRVQAVNEPGSFALRKALPAAWRGLRGTELDAATGIAGGVFVHAAGFIGGHDTEAGALAMAAAGLTTE